MSNSRLTQIGRPVRRKSKDHQTPTRATELPSTVVNEAKIGVIRNLFRPGEAGIPVYVEIIQGTQGEATTVYGATTCGRYEYRRALGSKSDIVREFKKKLHGRPWGHFFGYVDPSGLMIVDSSRPAPATPWCGPARFTFTASSDTLVLRQGGAEDVPLFTDKSGGNYSFNTLAREMLVAALTLFPLTSCSTSGKLLEPGPTADLLLDPDGDFQIGPFLCEGRQIDHDWTITPGEVLELIYQHYGDWSGDVMTRRNTKGHKVCPHGHGWGDCPARNCVPF